MSAGLPLKRRETRTGLDRAAAAAGTDQAALTRQISWFIQAFFSIGRNGIYRSRLTTVQLRYRGASPRSRIQLGNYCRASFCTNLRRFEGIDSNRGDGATRLCRKPDRIDKLTKRTSV
jgi:hypothetical protein